MENAFGIGSNNKNKRCPSTVADLVRVMAVLVCICVTSPAETLEDNAKPLSKEQVAELLGANKTNRLEWKKFIGADFTVYYGRDNEEPLEAVGIYLGGYPPFINDPSLPKKAGRLGMYEINWQRRNQLNHSGIVRWGNARFASQ